MKAAIVYEAGKNPVYGDFLDPDSSEREGTSIVEVSAAALSQLARSRASGSHYSSSKEFPAVAGVDGAGRFQDGQRVYFFLPEHPFGSMAEKSLVMKGRCIKLPDNLDDVTAAAIGIPGVSSWAALKERARLVKGETVVVNGATGTAGKLAVQIAKHLGAKKVIGTGRDSEVLKQIVMLGADETVSLLQSSEELETEFRRVFSKGVNVVLDYLWGMSAERLIIAAAKEGAVGFPIRYIAIGAVSDPNITLPNAALRSSSLELMGSGIGGIQIERLIQIMGELMRAVIPVGLKIETEIVPIADVEKAWNKASDKRRMVFTIP